ncbi:MAG TPA: flippase, partial [Candidatus Norongarragalinales archaeon]|nr:flippase [Candidatus Norongarragalinales archaeon]
MNPLKAIAKGSVLIFVGTLLGTFFKFGSNWLLANHLSPADFGAFSFAFSALNILASLSVMGTVYLMLKYLPQYLVHGQKIVAGRLLGFSGATTLIASLVLSIASAFFLSDYLSVQFLKNPAYSDVLFWMMLATPVFACLLLSVSIFQGFSRAKEKVLAFDLALNGLFLIFVSGLVFFGYLTLRNAVWIQALTLVFALVLSALFLNRLFRANRLALSMGASSSERREWFVFAAPLFVQDLFGLLLLWTDTFVLGMNLGAESLGAYFAATRLATALSLFLTAASYLYAPLASGFFSQNRTADVKRMYRTVTKWVTLATLPVFIVFILFPHVVLTFFYGNRFSEATTALSFLGLGYLAFTAFGPSGVTLISLGRNKFLVGSTVAAGVSNVLLSFLLIPMFGITGAALAAAGSMFLLKALISVELHRTHQISPFS